MTFKSHPFADSLDRWLPRVGTMGLLLMAFGLIALGFHLYAPSAPTPITNSFSVSEADVSEISSP